MRVPASVLIVEDDDDLRGLFKMAMALEGFAVQEARDGLEALRRLDVEVPAAIVLDLILPNVNGAEFLEELRSQVHTRDIPVVVVTANSDSLPPHVPVACILHKPVHGSELVRSVRRCMAASMERPAQAP